MSSLEQRLQDRVHELEALLGVGNDDVSRLLTVLDATPQQAEMVGFMLRRSVATRTALHTVLFGARPESDQPELKLIDVQMVKVRAALKSVGVEVRSEWGSGGWSIPAEDKAELRRLMTSRARRADVEKAKMRLMAAKVRRRTEEIVAERAKLRDRRMAFVEGS